MNQSSVSTPSTPSTSTPPTPSATSPAAVPFEAVDYFAGFDWACDHHDVAVVDRSGAIVLQLRFEQTLAGWTTLQQKLSTLGKVGVAIETSCGPAVERLLAMGHGVYPMNPKAAERYRDRKAPSGVKDDQLDAWSMGDALRTDGHGWRPLVPQDPGDPVPAALVPRRDRADRTAHCAGAATAGGVAGILSRGAGGF